VWQLHDRLDEYITEATCKVEIESFLEHGQLMPVLGRRTHNNSDCDVELIYGARRLFVARYLNKPLLVDLREELSDRDAAIALDIENRQRRDVSPYERGLCYSRWLRAGHFKSQEDIGRTMKISPAQVSRLLKLARLPSVIVGAFESGLDICEQWGIDLVDAVEDPSRRKAVIQVARAIAASKPRPPASEIYRLILAATGSGRKPRPGAHDSIIKARNGSPLFRVRHQRTSIALILPVELVSTAALEEIQHSLQLILEGRVLVDQKPPPLELELRAG
jgi:ParB family chromosome partitioning protein